MKHLISILPRLTPSDWNHRHWYFTAHGQLIDLASELSISLDTACAVTAVLSPRLPWDWNINEVRKVARGLPSSAYGDNVRKAIRLLDGESPESVVSGQKVTSFYRNLLNPSCTETVTVDTWALRAWSGDLGLTKAITPKQYGLIAEDYRAVARKIGLLPSELQASVWEFIRKKDLVL